MSNSMNSIWAVIPAAGVGKRSGLPIPKQYLVINGKTVLEHTIAALLACPDVAGAIIAISADDEWWAECKVTSPKPIVTVAGGAERCESVLNGLVELVKQQGNEVWALVHDAARPCVSAEELKTLVASATSHSVGGILALPMADTVKRAKANAEIAGTEDRSMLWRALTPQLFPAAKLANAIEHCLGNGLFVTDESSAMEQLGHAPLLVQGKATNIKLTHADDIPIVEQYLTSKDEK